MFAAQFGPSPAEAGAHAASFYDFNVESAVAFTIWHSMLWYHVI